MIVFVSDKNYSEFVSTVYKENVIAVDSNTFVSGMNTYLEGIKAKVKYSFFYKVEVDSVFVGYYFIDFRSRSVTFSQFRKSKVHWRDEIDKLISDFLKKSSHKFVTHNTFVLK